MSIEAVSQTARVAVLIDCDNISWQRATAVVAEAATHGVVGVKRGYGDWGSPYLTHWREQLPALAIQPVQQIAYVTGKGATDIALVIDAMDLLYSGTVDTFCLVTSDSDYTRLAMRLREAGKRVVGMGGKQTSAAFSNACDRFTFVEVLAASPLEDNSEVDELHTDEDEVPVSNAGGQTPKHAGEGPKPPAPEQPVPSAQAAAETPDLREMLSAAVTARLEDDGWALLSNVGWQLVGSHPTFDSRNYGYARLGQLVRDQDYLEIKEVPGPTGNQVIHVRLNEG